MLLIIASWWWLKAACTYVPRRLLLNLYSVLHPPHHTSNSGLVLQDEVFYYKSGRLLCWLCHLLFWRRPHVEKFAEMQFQRCAAAKHHFWGPV